jgi:hypothetical protein
MVRAHSCHAKRASPPAERCDSRSDQLMFEGDAVKTACPTLRFAKNTADRFASRQFVNPCQETIRTETAELKLMSNEYSYRSFHYQKAIVIALHHHFVGKRLDHAIHRRNARQRTGLSRPEHAQTRSPQDENTIFALANCRDTSDREAVRPATRYERPLADCMASSSPSLMGWKKLPNPM